MIKLVLHSIRLHLVQSVSVVLTVALAAAAIASFTQIYLGAEQGRKQASECGGAEYVVIPVESEQLLSDEDLLFTGAPATIYLPESDYDRVLELEGVSRATYQFYSQTLDSSCCSSANPTRLIGIDPASDFVITPLLPNGSDLTAMLQEGSMLIGSEVNGYESGRGQVLGAPQVVSAVLASTGTDLDHSIIVSVEVARSISARQAGYEHFWERYGEPETLVSTILVDFDEDSRDTAVAKLQSLSGVKVIERSEIVERSAAALNSMLTVLAGAGVVLAIASFLQLFARFYSMVWDRRAEFALFEAIGASRKTVFKLVGLEAGLLVSGGLLAGILLSYLLFSLLLGLTVGTGYSFAFITPDAGEIALIDGAIIGGFALLALLSILASLGRITRIDPSLAMRQVDIG